MTRAAQILTTGMTGINNELTAVCGSFFLKRSFIKTEKWMRRSSFIILGTVRLVARPLQHNLFL